MISNELLLMISNFLFGSYDPNDFSFDFPAKLNFFYEDFLVENKALCELLEEDMPEICAFFDPHNTGDPGTFGEKDFREKVLAVYEKAVPLARLTRVS